MPKNKKNFVRSFNFWNARNALFSIIIRMVNVSFWEWEKIPRLEAKTSVGLRYYGWLCVSQRLAFNLFPQGPYCMDYQVSQTGSLWRRGRAFTGSDTRNMPIHGYRYFERALLQRSCTSVCFTSSTDFCE